MGFIDELERLQVLRERGALSAEEFERAKARLFDEQPSAAGNTSTPWDDVSQGGAARGTGGAAFLRRLARSRTDRYLGGVCGGLGEHSELPSWGWRLIFCLVTLYFGAGVLLYLLLWVFLPLQSDEPVG